MALTRPKAAQVNFDVTNVTDPLIRLNSGQSGTNDKDVGIVIERGSDTNVGIIWDESADQIAIVNTTDDGTTQGNVTIGSYADIRANAFYGDGSNLTGIDAAVYGDSDVASYLSTNGYDTSSNIVASITDSAPATLDTLNELAAALGDDANFSTTVTNSIATKLPLAGGTMSGDITFSNTQLFDGRDVSADGTKLDGIESGATADQTASEILTAIKTVDGSGSGLDADTVDGYQTSSSATANSLALRDASANLTANEFNGTASSAKYADLAENYLADQAYPIGTVLDIGGDAEVTIATKDSCRVAGTVSENPGYLMNSELNGEYVTPVAYIGRVPCRVQGTIHRGDMLIVSSIPGVAVACHPKDILPGQAVGKALESFDNDSEGLIEILVGRL